MLHMMALTILVLFSQDILGLGATGYGLLLTAEAAGGVIGGLLAPRVVAHWGGLNSLRLALLLFPMQFLAIFVTSSPIIVAVALFIGTGAGVLWNVVTVSLRQRSIPDHLLGRVNSIYRFFGWGTMPIGALLGGAIVSLAEPELGRAAALRLPFVCAMVGCVMLEGYGFLRLRFEA